MESQFKAEDYDGGITTAVDGILNVFRAHMNSRPGAVAAGRVRTADARTPVIQEYISPCFGGSSSSSSAS